MTVLPAGGAKRSKAQVCLPVSSPVLPSAFQQVKRLRPPTGTADASAGTLQRCLLCQQLAVEWNIGKHTAGLLCQFCFVHFFLPSLPPSTAHHFPLLSSVCLPGSETDGSGFSLSFCQRRSLPTLSSMRSGCKQKRDRDVAHVQSHCGLRRGFFVCSREIRLIEVSA